MITTRFGLLRCILALVATAAASCAWAGGGPENVLLLVNSNSLGSQTIANHYIALRNIPPINVVYVDWRGEREFCGGVAFADQILQPAITAIGERGLSAQIDYVVYSSDFPWRVDLKTLFPDEKFERPTHPFASCTGATYLWQFVRDKNPALVLPVVNGYVSPTAGENYVQCRQLDNVKSRGFRATTLWTADGGKTTDRSKGQSYLLSAMLGVTTGRGNTESEILAYLKRAAAADGTRPRGTFYYMKSNDARSKPRHNCFDPAASQLKRMGVSAVVLPGVIPTGAKDVLGIMTGAADFNFSRSGSTLLPGAIFDNFTSYGGALQSDMGQTPLSEFLRAGAAGASGTVFEPFALQSKFPLPSLFIHYARGCSLAESFYQSVAGPYMLLVVGDPLCQPFAVAPQVAVEGIKAGQEVKGTLTIKATATTVPLQRVGTFEFFVDGRLLARFTPGRAPQLDTTKLSDGYHELRIVAINADAIETRGRLILPIVVNNHGQKLEFTVSSQSIAATDQVRITARQAGATSIVVRQNRREVARFQGAAGEVEVLAATFGRGPVILQAESAGPAATRSQPLRLEIR